MSSKLLPLIIQTTVPTGSENLAAGYHIGQSWLNTVTGILYIQNTDGVWNVVSLSVHASSHYAGASDQITGQSLSGLRTTDSPTFAELTTTGPIACQGGLFRQNGGDGEVTAVASSPSTAAWLVTLTDKEDYNGIRSTTSSYVDRWRIGRFGELSGIAFYEGVSRALWVTAAAPGTAAAGEVRIGGGNIDAAGAVTASGFAATADTNGVYNFLAPRNTNAGSSAYTLSYWGNDISAIEGYIILNSSTNTALAGAGSLNVGGAQALGLIAGGTVKALISAAGVATFSGSINAALGGSSLSLTPGSVDHCYLSFYPRTSNPSTRGGYFGFAGASHTTMTMVAELGYISFQSSYSPGTAGANEVRIGAGIISVYDHYKIGSYVQPRSTTTFVNIGASTYSDIYTLVTNDLVQVTVGNATDGYAAVATICKPSSGAAVIVTNNNSNANLTISLNGDAIRITNGVASTRTIIYCLTRLY